MPRHKTSAAVRINAHTVQSTDGCILSTARPSTQGGYICTTNDAGVQDYAHRVLYAEVHGQIPEGHEIHHTCETRICMNVDHMEQLTREEHLRRHALEKAAFHATCKPRIRNLFGMGKDRRAIKAATGATLAFIDGLIKSDRTLMNTDQAA